MSDIELIRIEGCKNPKANAVWTYVDLEEPETIGKLMFSGEVCPDYSPSDPLSEPVKFQVNVTGKEIVDLVKEDGKEVKHAEVIIKCPCTKCVCHE